jgi:hypothetical protein
MVPAWQIATWKQTSVLFQEWEEVILRMTPLGMSIHHDPRSNLCGQVVWGYQQGEIRIGIAWDWIRVSGDSLAMIDPMNILSNVVLLDQNGCQLDVACRLLNLNYAISRLPWQLQVSREHRDWKTEIAAA